MTDCSETGETRCRRGNGESLPVRSISLANGAGSHGDAAAAPISVDAYQWQKPRQTIDAANGWLPWADGGADQRYCEDAGAIRRFLTLDP